MTEVHVGRDGPRLDRPESRRKLLSYRVGSAPENGLGAVAEIDYRV